MNSRIAQLEKEIKYLKSNLGGIEGTFKIRMQEEIQNLEFDLNYLRTSSQQNTHIQAHDKQPTAIAV